MSTKTLRLERSGNSISLSHFFRAVRACARPGKGAGQGSGTCSRDVATNQRGLEKRVNTKRWILDLRGNGGGWVTTVQRLVGNLIDRDVKIGDSVSRKETKPFMAKTRGDKAFKGKLIMLVDSRSASASEVLSRTMQLEKRGLVIGDRTAGAVMTSRFFSDEIGLDVEVFYGASITVSDLIMSDGPSLEHRGVTPDDIRLPTAEDLAAGRDTVLSYAASLVGVKVDPVEAGKLFPIVRPKK